MSCVSQDWLLTPGMWAEYGDGAKALHIKANGANTKEVVNG